MTALGGRPIIGFGHKVGVGKDTAADWFTDQFDYQNLKFADSLKEACALIYGWNREELEDQDFKNTVDSFWGETPRVIMQRFGTEAMRDIMHSDIWVHSLQRRALNSSAPGFVVSDVRFPNEADAIRSWGGKLIKISRPDNPCIPASLDTNHASEIALDDYTNWNGQVVNDGSVEDLYDEIAASLCMA